MSTTTLSLKGGGTMDTKDNLLDAAMYAERLARVLYRGAGTFSAEGPSDELMALVADLQRELQEAGLI